MKKQIRRFFAVVMALTMVFAMSASAFAATDAGSATLNIYIVDESTGTGTCVDTMSVEAGQSVFDAINTLDYYEPKWQPGTDIFDGSETQYLASFVGYPSFVNVDYFYNPDPNKESWSKDWGWMYTVDDAMPAFPDDPNHGMAMNQYTIQAGDSIDVAYTLTETTWIESTGETTYKIIYNWK